MRLMVSSSYCLVILFITWQFGIQPMDCASVLSSCQLETYSRILVVDAGSTETRVYFYSFKIKSGSDKHKLKPLDLEVDNFKILSTKESLTSIDTPRKLPELRKIMQALLTEAESKLDLNSKCFPYIPIYFRGTAGLRSKTKIMQNLIIEEVKKTIQKFKLKKVRNNVSIMSGENEGLYAWMALNYARGTLNSDQLDKSYSVLALGGGSMQVGTVKYSEEYANLVKTYDLFDKKYSLLIKSYLGFGLQNIRIFFFNTDNKGICINKDANYEYELGTVKKTLTGKEIDNEQRYDICFTIAKALVKDIDPIWTFVDDPGQIQAIRGFYFAVRDANHILKTCAADNSKPDCQKKIFQKSIKDLETEAKTICKSPPTAGNEQIPLCIDLTYIISLLKYGYNIKDLDKKIIFSNEVDGQDIQWSFGIASGAAFKTLSSASKAIYAYSILSVIAPLILTLRNMSE